MKLCIKMLIVVGVEPVVEEAPTDLYTKKVKSVTMLKV